MFLLMGLVFGTYMTCLFVWRFWTLNSYQFEEKYESNSKFLKFYRPLILNSSGFSYLPPHILNDFIMGFPHKAAGETLRLDHIRSTEVRWMGSIFQTNGFYPWAQRWHPWKSTETPKSHRNIEKKGKSSEPNLHDFGVPAVNFPGCFFSMLGTFRCEESGMTIHWWKNVQGILST